MTRIEAETAIDNGTMFARMRNGNWWRVRRNGKTQTWKTRPDDFRVPIKAGLKAYGNFTQADLTSGDFEIRN